MAKEEEQVINKGPILGMFGSYLMAIYDPDEDIYYSICKVGTGFKDVMLKEFTARFTENIVESKPPNYIVDTFIKPDVWFTPKNVWEVTADSFSASKYYTIGDDINTSLRFPRFVKERHDKDISSSSGGKIV